MPQTERNDPNGERDEQWLGADQPARARPWAYEELLLGAARLREQARELDAVVEELRLERDELARLHLELNEHFVRIEELEQKLRELAPAERKRPAPARVLPHTQVVREAPEDGGDRDYALSRCEGFVVDSPEGPVGLVEGLRFVTRIDCPDLLEVRGGRFGRQLLLIPSDQVEDIIPEEERVLVRTVSAPSGDLLGGLLDRVRRAVLGTTINP